MPTLTLMPGGEAPSIQSQYTPDCPNWLFAIVHDQEISIESSCGRYFEWLDDCGDDIAELINDADCSALADGLYVVEGHVVTHLVILDHNDRETEWYFDRVRPLESAEWHRYREGADIWDPAHIDPAFTEQVVDEVTSEFQALLEAGKGWLAWRRNLEIDLCPAEIALVAAVHALGHEDEGDSSVSS